MHLILINIENLIFSFYKYHHSITRHKKKKNLKKKKPIFIETTYMFKPQITYTCMYNFWDNYKSQIFWMQWQHIIRYLCKKNLTLHALKLNPYSFASDKIEWDI